MYFGSLNYKNRLHDLLNWNPWWFVLGGAMTSYLPDVGPTCHCHKQSDRGEGGLAATAGVRPAEQGVALPRSLAIAPQHHTTYDLLHLAAAMRLGYQCQRDWYLMSTTGADPYLPLLLGLENPSLWSSRPSCPRGRGGGRDKAPAGLPLVCT